MSFPVRLLPGLLGPAARAAQAIQLLDLQLTAQQGEPHQLEQLFPAQVEMAVIEELVPVELLMAEQGERQQPLLRFVNLSLILGLLAGL